MSARTASIAARALLFLLGVTAVFLAIVLAAAGELLWTALAVLVGGGVTAAVRMLSRKSPVAFPSYLRWLLDVPRGPHAPKRLLRQLQPVRGERILEVGPGAGVHALPVACALLPDGALAVLDVQRAMLAALMRRGAGGRVDNILPSQGDARRLPYADRVFAAAYLVGVLGEVPDPDGALRELHRVLRPGGRLVVAELVIDPDYVSQRALKVMAERAGFVVVRFAGPALAYTAVLARREAPPEVARR